jgi:hypothetical protein
MRFKTDFKQNGDIIDVPAEVVQSSTRYAIPVEPFDSPQSIFCSTCLKNQYMYTDAMSHFLPDDDHPEYPQFEAALPEFKKRMERQYPQCCIDCEPKVQEQLQQATYHARSDNLRRVLDRSRKILRPLVNRFIVQWPQLQEDGIEYIGPLVS